MRNTKASPKRRSECPPNASVEILGDRWSLPIYPRHDAPRIPKEFPESYERIATNILTDRLVEIGSSWNPHHRARSIGWTKADLLADSKRNRSWTAPHANAAWADAHDDSGNQALVRLIYKDQQQFLAAVPPRWAEKTSR